MSGILNIILGILLISMPSEAMLSVFAFLFAIERMMIGMKEIAYYNRMKFFAFRTAAG